MSVCDQLAEYIRCNISPVQKDTLGADDDLLEQGLIDSLGIVQLLEYISEEFSTDIDADDIRPENFASVRAIEALISKKRQ